MPTDALWRPEMDVLVLENHILYKSEQPPENKVSKGFPYFTIFIGLTFC
jgi:hypothetical protein